MAEQRGGECGVNGWREEMQKGLVGKHDGKRPLGRLQYRWADNVKMYVK
jgi:hypothetical protein